MTADDSCTVAEASRIARMTRLRRLMEARAPLGTAQGRRVRLLFRTYLKRLGDGPHDDVMQAGAMRAAELTVLCENLRARALAGETIGANDITRMESTSRRAEHDLFGKVELADPMLELPEYAENPHEDSANGDR